VEANITCGLTLQQAAVLELHNRVWSPGMCGVPHVSPTRHTNHDWHDLVVPGNKYTWPLAGGCSPETGGSKEAGGDVCKPWGGHEAGVGTCVSLFISMPVRMRLNVHVHLRVHREHKRLCRPVAIRLLLSRPIALHTLRCCIMLVHSLQVMEASKPLEAL